MQHGRDGIRRVRQPDFVPPAGPGCEREVHDDLRIYDGGKAATPAQDHGNADGREGMVQPRQLWQRDCAEGAGGQWHAEDTDGRNVQFGRQLRNQPDGRAGQEREHRAKRERGCAALCDGRERTDGELHIRRVEPGDGGAGERRREYVPERLYVRERPNQDGQAQHDGQHERRNVHL